MSVVDFLLRFSEVGLKGVSSTAQGVMNRLSSGVSGAASTAQRALGVVGATGAQMGNQVSGGSANAVSGLNNIASSAQSAAAQVNNLNNSLNNMHSGGGSGGGFWKSSGAMFVGSMAERGVELAARKVEEIGRESLTAGMDKEQAIIGLNTFVGDRSAALYDKIQRESGLTPFTTAQIMPGMIPLLAAEKTPERAQRDFWALMNALSAVGHAGDGAMLSLTEGHLGSMAASGSVDAMYVKEFQRTASIPIFDLLAKEILPGMSHKKGMKQIADWTESGELKQHVNYEQFTDALYHASQAGGKFAGALEAQSKTMKGKASTIADWWNIGLSNLTLSEKDKITSLEDKLISGLEHFPEHIAKFVGWFDDVLPHFKNWFDGAMGFFEPLGKLAVSNEVKDLLKSFADLSGTIYHDLKPAMEVAGWLAKKAAGVAGLTLSGVNADLDIENAAKAATKTFDEMPSWGKSLSMMGWGKSDFGDLHDYIKKQYGGKIEPWMNDWKQESYWKEYHKLDESLKPLKGVGASAGYLFSGYGGQSGPVAAGSGAAAEMSESIVGGGRKMININFRNFVEHLEIKSGSLKEGLHETESELKEMLLRIFAGLPA